MARVKSSGIIYVRTESGQLFYDIAFSRMSAMAVVRKWKKKWPEISCEVVLRHRRTDCKEFRPKS